MIDDDWWWMKLVHRGSWWTDYDRGAIGNGIQFRMTIGMRNGWMYQSTVGWLKTSIHQGRMIIMVLVTAWLEYNHDYEHCHHDHSNHVIIDGWLLRQFMDTVQPSWMDQTKHYHPKTSCWLWTVVININSWLLILGMTNSNLTGNHWCGPWLIPIASQHPQR